MPEKVEKPEQVKGHCPQCGADRYADVVGEHLVADSDTLSGIWWESRYRMLSCGGCKSVYFQEIYTFSEDFDYATHPVTNETIIEYNRKITFWPAPTKR